MQRGSIESQMIVGPPLIIPDPTPLSFQFDKASHFLMTDYGRASEHFALTGEAMQINQRRSSSSPQGFKVGIHSGGAPRTLFIDTI
jgi:hypothetical protein